MSAIAAPIEDLVTERGARSRYTSAEGVARAIARCGPTVIRSGATATVPLLETLTRLSRGDSPEPVDPPLTSSGADVISAAIDACATRTRVYTATDSEGLLRMAPALFRASELGLPIVMTVLSSARRPDHSHAMAMRDCGWIQLYPSDEQDAVDTHIQAFRIAESLSLPVMVCMDAFMRTHALEPPLLPPSDEVDAFLNSGEPTPAAQPGGAGERPEMHMEMRYLAHTQQSVALETIRKVAADFRNHFGRRSGGVFSPHRLYAANVAVLGLGSAFEVITGVVDALRPEGVSVGAIGLRSFRPFPSHDLAALLVHCRRVVVVERAVAVGIGGIVSTDVRSALVPMPIGVHTVIAGLGDRPIAADPLRRILYRAARGNLEELSFLDIDRRAHRRASDT